MITILKDGKEYLYFGIISREEPLVIKKCFKASIIKSFIVSSLILLYMYSF